MELNWSKPREVNTRFGPRIVKSAPVTEEFWTEWRAHKADLKAEGYSVGKNRNDQWEVTHWGKLDGEETTKREAEVEASRAAEMPAGVDLVAPNGLTYLPFQAAGIAYAMNRTATLIADEMGLGKTIQAIGILNSMADAKRVLVVCPASLKINWKRELEKWCVFKYDIHIVNGGAFWNAAGDKPSIAIINYDILHKHHEALHSIHWDLLIVDEAHYCKTRDARRTRMLFGFQPTKKQMAKGEEGMPPIRAERRILLTGTPITNRPAELFPLIHYLDPAGWPNFFSYAKRYCAAYQNRWGWDFTGASNLPELQEKLRRTLMVRRLKKDVLTELPAKRRQVIEMPVPVSAGEAVRKEMDAYESRADRIAELQARVELAKATDDPQEHAEAVAALKAGVTALFNEMSKLRHDTAVAKIPAVIEFVRDAIEGSGKVVLFAHHKDVVRAIAAEFGDEAVILVGDTPQVERQKAVDRFQTDPNVKLFIGSTLAAGVGITLTASSHVIFAELDWVPGNVSQAEDRCHRIGQANSVLVQHLVLEGSLDATMAQRIVAKQNVIDRALDVNGKPVYDEMPAPTHKAEAATVETKRDRLAKQAEKITKDQIAVAHTAVQMIAGMCDGAAALDDHGFSKIDVVMGHSLARQANLSPKQGVLAAVLARKYRRQLPENVNAVVAGFWESFKEEGKA